MSLMKNVFLLSVLALCFIQNATAQGEIESVIDEEFNQITLVGHVLDVEVGIANSKFIDFGFDSNIAGIEKCTINPGEIEFFQTNADEGALERNQALNIECGFFGEDEEYGPYYSCLFDDSRWYEITLDVQKGQFPILDQESGELIEWTDFYCHSVSNIVEVAAPEIGISDETPIEEEIEIIVPTITTPVSSMVKRTKSQFDFDVTDKGNGNIESCGVLVSQTSEFTDETKFLGTVDESLHCATSVSGLLPNSKYFIKSFAQNEAGVTYGDAIEITTLEIPVFKCPSKLKILSTGFNYRMVLEEKEYFVVGSTFEINMLSNMYSFGQADVVELYLNGELKHTFGKWVSVNGRPFTIPEDLESSNCYYLKIKKGTDIYYSPYFTIID